jgi:hypothetical protein
MEKPKKLEWSRTVLDHSWLLGMAMNALNLFLLPLVGGCSGNKLSLLKDNK